MRNAKVLRFIEEYPLDGNATQAAIRAGYSAKTAHVTGCKLLRKHKTEIEARLAEQKAALRKQVGVTKERIIRELACIAFSDAADFFDRFGNPIEIPDLKPRARRAIAGFEFTEDFLNAKDKSGNTERQAAGYTKKYKLADKIRANDLIAKLLGYLKEEKSAESGNVTIIVQQFTDQTKVVIDPKIMTNLKQIEGSEP